MSEQQQPLVNRVAASGLITIKLEEFYPQTAVVAFDLKDYLFKELILKEKDFRAALKSHDWAQYEGKVLAVYCSNKAIIPMWAYMLVSAYASSNALDVYQGTPEAYYSYYFTIKINSLDIESYKDQRIILKGCGDVPIPASAYLEFTKRLRPIAKSIMYGEPCSTVPIYKKPKVRKV